MVLCAFNYPAYCVPIKQFQAKYQITKDLVNNNRKCNSETVKAHL